jgi:uncharacterized membrane protein YvlD (DUF360 family)
MRRGAAFVTFGLFLLVVNGLMLMLTTTLGRAVSVMTGDARIRSIWRSAGR